MQDPRGTTLLGNRKREANTTLPSSPNDSDGGNSPVFPLESECSQQLVNRSDGIHLSNKLAEIGICHPTNHVTRIVCDYCGKL